MSESDDGNVVEALTPRHVVVVVTWVTDHVVHGNALTPDSLRGVSHPNPNLEHPGVEGGETVSGRQHMVAINLKITGRVSPYFSHKYC